MANRKLSMNKLRQVLRCHANGNGAKSISNLTGIVDILNKLTPYGLFKLTPIDNL